MKGCVKSMVAITLALLTLFSGAVNAGDTLEKKKIEFLIAAVENLQGAKFIRNSTEHTGKEAAEHLRMKLQKAGNRVRTADDFIRLCASKSFLSGKAYMIRSSAGKTIPSEEFFREKLKEYTATVQ